MGWDAKKQKDKDIYIYKGYVYEISYGYTRRREWDDGNADGVGWMFMYVNACVYRVARLFFAAAVLEEELCTEKVRLIVRESLFRCAVTFAWI